MIDIQKKVEAGDVLAFYSTQIWKRKRREILERDHYQCQRCLGKYKPEPGRVPRLTRARTVHHDIPLRECFALALVDRNLVSLCFRCHEEIEGRADWKINNTVERLTEERW